MIIITTFKMGIYPGSWMWMVSASVLWQIGCLLSFPHRSHLLSPTHHTVYYANNRGQFIKARALPWCDDQCGGQLSGLRPIEGLPVLGMRQVLHSRDCTISAQNCERFVLKIVHDLCSKLCTICAQLCCCCCVSFTLTLTHSVALSIWVTWSFNYVVLPLYILSQSFSPPNAVNHLLSLGS